MNIFNKMLSFLNRLGGCLIIWGVIIAVIAGASGLALLVYTLFFYTK